MDRTYLHAIVWDCPPEQRAALLAVLTDGVDEPDPSHYGEGLDLTGSMNEGAPEELMLGERYGWEECPLDAHYTLAGGIIDAAPGATFECWVDPKYEYEGERVAYAPDLGRFDSPCTEAGEPYIEGRAVREIVTAADLDCAAKVAKIEAALGLPWDQRIETLRGALVKETAR